MTYRQYGTLKYIRANELVNTQLRMLNMTTLGSLVQKGWVKKNGFILLISDAGEAAYQEYAHATLSKRKREGEISERVRLMLNLKISRNHA